jgi:uncharacterized membrane protein
MDVAVGAPIPVVKVVTVGAEVPFGVISRTSAYDAEQLPASSSTKTFVPSLAMPTILENVLDDPLLEQPAVVEPKNGVVTPVEILTC